MVTEKKFEDRLTDITKKINEEKIKTNPNEIQLVTYNQLHQHTIKKLDEANFQTAKAVYKVYKTIVKEVFVK